MAKDAVSEHSDHDLSAHQVSERDDVSRVQEEPSRERWRVVGETLAESSDSSSDARGGHDLALPAAPIVGIASQSEVRSPARPRFKTLMGVPRNDPNLELYADNPLLDAALLEAEEGTAATRDGSSSDGASSEGGMDTAARATAVDEERAAAPEVRAEPEAAADPVLPRGKFSGTVRLPREVHGQFAASTPTSFDLRDEVAALRHGGGAKRWLPALGGLCAAAVLLLYVPREWRMSLITAPVVRQDDAALLVSSWQATQTLGALRPETSRSSPAPALSNASGVAFPERATADVAPKEESRGAVPSPSAAGSTAAAWSVRVSSNSSGPTEHAPTEHPSLRAQDEKVPHSEHARAAPRKGATGRGTREQTGMKALFTRQNPPRKGGGNGIIRDTPF